MRDHVKKPWPISRQDNGLLYNLPTESSFEGQSVSPWCHAPSWLNLGELSHTHIHLTIDHDLTQLNAPPCMANMEYSPTWTSLGRQGWHIDSAHTIFIHLTYNTL